MEQGLKILLEAQDVNVKQTFAAVAQATDKSLTEISSAAVNAALVTERSFTELEKKVQFFGGSVKKFVTNFRNDLPKMPPILPPIPANVPASFDGLSRKANSAAGTIHSFNQVLREAPAFAFSTATGLLAISNNLPLLVDNLKAARANGQSFGSILKDLGKGLFSFGGIATIAITTATILAARMGSGGNEAKKAADKIREAEDALRDYVDGLNDIAKARVEGAQSAQKELVSLQSLYTASQNQNLSLSERKKAVDALQQQYPAYFRNLSDEAILAGKGADAYDKLTKAIIASSFAKAQEKTLVGLNEQLIAINQQITDQTDGLAKVAGVLDKVKRAAGSADINLNTGLSSETGKVTALTKDYNEASKALNGTLQQRFQLEQRIKQLGGALAGNVQQNGVGILTDEYKVKLKADKPSAKEAVNDLAEYVKKLMLDIDFGQVPDVSKKFSRDIVGAFIDDLNAAATRDAGIAEIIPKEIQKMLDSASDFAKVGERIGGSVGNGFDKVFSKMFKEGLLVQISKGKTGEQLEQFKSSLAAVGTVAADLFIGVGDAASAMFDALANGGNALKAFGQTLLTSIQQVIGKLIQAAALGAILSLISGGAGTALNPKNGFSFMEGFKGLLSGIPGMATGGIVPPGYPNDTFMARLSSGEAVIPLNRWKDLMPSLAGQPSQITGEFRVRGTDLIAVLTKEQNSQRRRF